MRIAQVAPLVESVPPKFYGGTERVVSYLTEELVRQGHEVTLYASGDSRTCAHLTPVCETALRMCPGCADPMPHHLMLIEKVLQDADSFDVIHFHIDLLHFSAFRRHPTPTVSTLHGRLDLPDIVPLYREFSDVPVVSISNHQRAPLPWLNWQQTIFHGLPEDLLEFHPGPGSYLAFLGRISPEKRVDRAIRIAIDAGMELKIAAKVDKADRDYFDDAIKPLLDHSLVEFVGEITDREKGDFLGNACGLLFPIDWPEPFGLAMIEAMACGTPVIAYRRGSVPEVIDDGVTGFIVDSHAAAVAATGKLHELNRRRIRHVFDQKYTAARMAREYLSIYRNLPKYRESPESLEWPIRAA